MLNFFLYLRLLTSYRLCNYLLNISNWISNRHLKLKMLTK